MPSDQHNLTMVKATGLIFLLFGIASELWHAAVHTVHS